MAEIRLVDVSLRDGNQSLWGATGLRTAHIATIAPLLGRAGFRALDYSSSTAMGMSVRRHREDPWALLRISRAAMPDTPLQFIGTGFRFISWERAHPEVIELVYRTLVRNGMDRFVVLDPSHDMDAARATARIAKKAGGARGHRRADLHDLGGARRRVLRGHRRRLPGLPGHRPRLHQGPGGHPHPGPGADADPRRAGGARRQAARAALARHARAVAAHLPGRGRARRARAPGRLRRARQRDARCRTPSSWSPTCAPAGTPSTSTTGCSAAVARYFDRLAGGRGAAAGRAPGRSTRRSWTTSWRAGSCRRPGGSWPSSASRTGSTR